MRKSVLALFLFGCLGISQAQTSRNEDGKDYRNYPHWIDMMQDPQANFFETQRAFNAYWKGRKVEKGGGYKPFKRWEHFMAQQVDEKGNKPQANQILNELQNVQTTSVNPEMAILSGWQEVGPVQLPSNGTGQPNGLGRINAIGFHPTNANTFYVGAPAGGLWTTTDGGSTWSSNTDQLATLGVSAIVVDHTNPNTIYFGSGDRDASDAPGLGVFKSTDGGTSWNQSSSGMGNRTVGELVMDPGNNSILIAATNGGVYRSTNSGSTWSQSISGNFKDLKLHPTNSSIIYAASGGNLYKSTDNGASFSLSMSGIPSGKSRLAIGVSPASPNTVYVLAAQGSVYGGLFKSTDSGATFTTQSTTPNIMDYSTNGSGTSGQAWYDMCIAVSPTNANEVYVGGVNVFKSTNSGSTWTINAHWVGSGGASAVHADQHILRYSPAGKLYVGNDGGVYHKGTSNENWTDISSGLAISQCYKIGQSQTDVNRVIVGYQDNGTGIYDNGNWRTEIGGDGMESAIDYTNSAYMYGELYYGAIRRSTNNGYSFSNIAGNGVNGITESGAWVTPYVLHETDPNTMFVGYRDIWRSTNVKASSTSSVSWTEISTNLGGSGAFSFIEHNEANSNILYASKGSALFKSENVMAASVTWSTLTTPGSGSILSIETSELDENVVYITRGSRIYQSTDKGSTWTDISSNITNSQNKTSLVYAPMAIGRGLYVATDYGVFFKPENESDWINYSQGLPNYAKIKEIELYEDASGNNNHKIRAASYGRGLWSNDIYLTGDVITLDATSANICLGDTATFTADNATTYFWTDPNGTVVSNSAILEANPTQTTVYTVNGIMSNGDTTQANATVNVITPVVTVAGQSSVCTGSSATLTANVSGSGSYSYLWSNGATTQSITINPTTSTTYSVTATSTEGCSASATHVVNMVGAADYLIVEIKTDNYPTETSWTLTGNSGNVYQTISQGFYSSANTVYFDTIFCVTDSCLVFNMNDSYGDGICCAYGQGYYKIFQSDGTLLTSGGAFTNTTTSNFCLQSSVFELTVANSNIEACLNESVTFTASGADTYEWVNQSGSIISTSDELTVLAQSNTTYTVYGYQNGDTLSEVVNLTTNTAFVSISGNTDACENGSITLTASGSNTYIWSTGETSNSITIPYSAGASTTAWVIGESNGCYSDTAYSNLNWIPNPTVSIIGGSNICNGDSVTLSAMGADTYLWSTGETSQSITILPNATTVYTVQGTTNGCTSNVATETITVNPTPIVSIAGANTICIGETITLTATGADSYLWSTGETSSSITLSPSTTTSISVQGTSLGCTSNIVSETILVNPTPLVTVSGNETICAGETVTLTAVGAEAYVWSNGSTGSSITITPEASLSVTVQGTSLGCTSDLVSHSIVVNTIPEVTITGNTVVCEGDSVTLTANGAESYVWSNGQTGQSIVMVPNANTTISVQGTNLGCTSESVTESITVNAIPQISVSGNSPICNGDSITLIASGAESYVWSNGQTGNMITLTPNASTTLTVQGFINGCGSDIISETITVNPTPNITIEGNSVVCLGDTAELSVFGADSYVWSTGETTSSISFIPSSTTTVTVQGFTNGCSSAVLSHIVMVNTSTEVSVSGNTDLCIGESTTLTASGAESYVWSDGSTGSSITISPEATTTITVQGFTSECGSDMVSETIQVFATPTITVSGNTEVCSGDSITLVANGANTYVWSNGSTSNSVTLSPDSNMNISVQGFTNGCESNTVSNTITVNQLPVISISGNTTVCPGDSIILTATGADTYLWSDGSTGSSITLVPSSTMSVSVQGFTLECSSEVITKMVIVNPTPTVSISGNTEICTGDSITLTASGAESYIWSNGSTEDFITIFPEEMTTVSVQGYTSGCGSDIVSETIQVLPTPIISVSGNSEICAGDSITLFASGADSYLWSNGSISNMITLTPNANMNISVQGFINGCVSNTVLNTITVNPVPVVSISGNTTICPGDSVVLTATGANSYVWSNGSTGSSITLVPGSSSSVSVQGFSNGCSSDVVYETITVLATPTVQITGNTNVCNGDSIMLVASGAQTYVWSDGSTGSTLTFIPDSSMTITVEGFISGCGSDMVSEEITVYATPVVTVSGNTALCSGESITLTASGANTYLWSTGDTSSSITITPDSSMLVFVEGFSNGCLSNVVVETIEVTPNPVVTLTGSTSICPGDSVLLTASGANSYMWSTGETSQSILVSPVFTSAYTVQGFSNGCSSDVVSTIISIGTTPQISISGNTEICNGDSTILTVTGAQSYLWSNGSTNSSIIISPNSTTTISVQGFTTGCGSDMVSETIVVNANPTVTISGNTEICSGDSTTLTVTGADSYVWSNGSTGNSITVVSGSVVSVQGFINGCASDVVSETITAYSTPVVTISGNTSVCNGDSIILTATGANSYMWSNGSTGNSITLVPTSSSTISVQGFVNGCASELVTDTIFVNPNPIVTISGNNTICEGESVVLTANGADAYVWSNGSTSQSITLSPNATLTISVQGITNGCYSDPVLETVIVNALPVVNILGNTTVCLGDTVTLSASTGDSFLWSTGDTTSTIQVIPTSDMMISLDVSSNGCFTSSTATIEVIESPTVEITGDVDACIGESITLTASGADTYVWSTGDTTESITVIVEDSTTITVVGTNGGCSSATESINIAPNPNSSYFVIAIKTDWYAYETTWTLDDGQGNNIASHTNTYGSYQNNTWYRDTIYCATIGNCYSFTINDSYGDGICCAYGSGEYSITHEDGTIFAQGGDFDYSETSHFCIGEPLTEINVEISEDDLTVCKQEEFSLTASGATSYIWTTLNGNIVSQDPMLTTQLNNTTTYVVTGTTGSIVDTDTITVEVITNKIKIIIKTDWYGYETSWKLKDSSGDVVAERAPYTYQNNHKYKHTIKCLPDECYTLEVYDSYGDGMCCAYGYGYFKVVGPGNVVLASGGQFGHQTSASFCFGGPAAKALPYEDMDNVITPYIEKTAPSGVDLSSIDNITVYPNPSQGDLFIDADDSDFLIDRYEITDLSGRLLLDETTDEPFKSKMIDISSFTQGQYLVKLFIGNHVKVVKIIKE